MNDIVPILTNIGSHILAFLNSIPAEYYVVIVASLPFSIIVALVKSVIVRHWDTQPSEVKMFLTNMGGLALMATAAYLQTTPTTDPYVAIGSLIGFTTVIQQPFFFKVVKPFVASFWEQWDKGSALNDELKSAAVPPSGLPLDK